MKKYLKLMRVKHYLKNFLIFLPIVFGQQLFDYNKVILCLLGFLSFCLVASCVYIINDIRDVEKDRKHPVKCKRPIASGEISKKAAIVLLVILLIISIILNAGIYFLTNNILVLAGVGVEAFYFFMNIFYSFGLKNIPIVDVVILVLGFVIRVLYGSIICDIRISKWLYLTIMSGSFYMGFGKRRNEINMQGDKSRAVLKKYTKEFLNNFMNIFLTLSIVFYSLWCVDDSTIQRFGNGYLAITIPILMVILIKYSLTLERADCTGDPVDVLYNDKIIILLAGLLALTMFGIIYFL